MMHANRFSVQSGWKLLIRDMGINPADVLRLAELPADLFARKDASLTPLEYFNFWQGLERAAGSEALPLKIGQVISVETFDPPIFASLCSPNLNTALQRLSQFKMLIGPLTLAVNIDAERTTATLDCYDDLRPIPRSLAASELVFFTQLARLATRQRIVPIDLSLTQLPENLTPYETYFGHPLRQSDRNQIAFSAQDAQHPFLTENAGMWSFFESGLKKRLSDLDAEATMSQRVRSALLEMLPGGQSTIEQVATRLAMTKRSLQRYLSEESTGYQDVLNATRKELARHYLARSSISPGEIAWLLGFQDGNSFNRAFKGWTGITPGEYRSRTSEASTCHTDVD
ncbi:AraC family transcriptional regulator ligand-binding domain-containing protein [Collimonas sp. H4R21]|uniref:AraC family transcriptional regulator ligand-binding domain-containing protein n=1 Tax=Collimonas rhizosphaerae TaxID=3126357 RepID=A0ABU9PU44_9BURK